MTDQEVLIFFKKNPFRYANFREIAKALNWDFSHDIFDDVPVQCIVYQPKIRHLLVSELGERYTRSVTTGCWGCFVGKLKTVFINLHIIKKHSPNRLYENLLSVIEHEYLHAYFRHTNMLKNHPRMADITHIRKAYMGSYEGAWVKYYLKYYKKRSDFAYILEEEFLIQLYTNQFDFGKAAGSRYLDSLMERFGDMHPYFARAKMPKHLAKKLEQIQYPTNNLHTP